MKSFKTFGTQESTRDYPIANPNSAAFPLRSALSSNKKA